MKPVIPIAVICIASPILVYVAVISENCDAYGQYMGDEPWEWVQMLPNNTKNWEDYEAECSPPNSCYRPKCVPGYTCLDIYMKPRHTDQINTTMQTEPEEIGGSIPVALQNHTDIGAPC